MGKYIVQGISIDHNGKPYREGDEIELSAAEAKPLAAWLKPLAAWLKPAAEKASGKTDPKTGDKK
ncbi:MAG: hypothetical protein LBU76_08385 [Azoarcus sp.]|jgi:hypothetical protein|nr:hypothetical protein [Azoarcus sp.]